MHLKQLVICALALLGAVHCTVIIVSKTKANWHQANNECRLLGYRLAVIDTAAKQAQLASVINLNNLRNCRFWLSGNNLDQPGANAYTWYSNGRPFGSYQNWLAGQPANCGLNNCVQTTPPDHKWSDAVCSEEWNYACEDTCCEC